MAIIGKFHTKEDGFAGHIETLTLSAAVSIQPFIKTTDNGPDYRLRSHGAEIGAAWAKTTDLGERYLSVKVDDPSFPTPIHCTLKSMDNSKALYLIWAR